MERMFERVYEAEKRQYAGVAEQVELRTRVLCWIESGTRGSRSRESSCGEAGMTEIASTRWTVVL
jgi:hypothetical protein